MEYRIQHDRDMDVCIVHVTGKHRRPEDSMQLQVFAREYRAEHDCSRFLFDMRQARITGGVLPAWQTATAPLEQGMKPYDYRVALVYSGDLSEHKFMELVSRNRGYALRVFDEFDRAMHWLGSDEW